MSAIQFACYAPHPAVQLDPRDRAIRQILHEARGFYRTRGLRKQDIRRSLVRNASFLAAFGRNLPTLGVVHRALVRLEKVGLAKQVAPGQWVEAGRA